MLFEIDGSVDRREIGLQPNTTTPSYIEIYVKRPDGSKVLLATLLGSGNGLVLTRATLSNPSADGISNDGTGKILLSE